MKLSNLKHRPGARHRRKIVGKGEGSGHGKTSCRGGKGQTARKSGNVRVGFEGGQMPLYRRVGKFGFRSRKDVFGLNSFLEINLSDLNKFENGSVVDEAALKAKGYSAGEGVRGGIKILGNGKLEKKLTVKANAFSESAKAQIEKAGGVAEKI